MSKKTWRNRIVGHGEEDPEQLAANPKNWRIHPHEQERALVGSLSEVGWVQSVIVNKRTGFVVDGHMRVAAAISNEEKSIPVVYVDLSDREESIVLASLDPIGSMAGTDQEMLDTLIGSVNVDDDALKDLLESLASPAPTSVPGSINEDDIPEAPPTSETIVRHGELWKIGNHRLLVGDCTDAKNVKRLFGSSRAVLAVFSPPYWVGREYEQEHGEQEIIAHIQDSAAAIVKAMASKSKIVINTGTTSETRQGGSVRRVWLLLPWWQDALLKHGWNMRNVRIWTKEGGFSGFAPAQDLSGQDWEFLADFTSDVNVAQNRLSDAPRWALDGVWDCQPQTAHVGHSAPFPVEIPRRYMLLYSQPDDIVYEPYCGSGTTIIAGEQLKRRVYACEIEPTYAQLSIERVMRDTGIEAVRDDGTTWSELLKAQKVAA